MGTTDNLKEVLQKYELKARSCYSCSQTFTNLDLQEDNYQVLFRTNNDTDWTDFPLREGRGWVSIEIQLEHKWCVAIEEQTLTKRPSREKDHE